MASKVQTVSITRWHGSQHPSMANIMRQIQHGGLRPYTWSNTPNHRYAVRSHNYDKVLYVVEGTIEVTLPDSNQRVTLKVGDRIDIPASVRHGMIVGRSGATCVEVNQRTARRR
ncbi:MAG: cupin domain-containing protein [Anaerolineae bacterium]